MPVFQRLAVQFVKSAAYSKDACTSHPCSTEAFGLVILGVRKHRTVPAADFYMCKRGSPGTISVKFCMQVSKWLKYKMA